MTAPSPRGAASAEPEPVAPPGPGDAPTRLPRPVLVAGMGNLLQRDDGFGPLVVRRLREEGLPPDVRALDAGIGGIHLVQELMDGFGTLLLLDAVAGGRPPGTVSVLEPRVPDHVELERADEAFFAETHYAVPAKALVLARALAVLPERVYIVGCEPLDTGQGLGVTETVARAVETGVRRVRELLGEGP